MIMYVNRIIKFKEEFERDEDRKKRKVVKH